MQHARRLEIIFKQIKNFKSCTFYATWPPEAKDKRTFLLSLVHEAYALKRNNGIDITKRERKSCLRNEKNVCFNN